MTDSDLLEILAAGSPAAFASDSRERIVFWNRGAAELFGRGADDALGRHCWEIVGGRDVFGNRFCYGNCTVAHSLRAGENVCGFEMRVAANGRGPTLAHVTILRIPSIRPDLFTVVHILEPLEESSRLARTLEAMGAEPSCAAPWAHAARAAEPQAPPPPPLTNREREVLRWIARGLQNKEIAQKLDLSLATVRNHIHNILDKLGLHSKLEAVSMAFRHGWVQDEPPAAPARTCLR
jgi:DNA-binding CsgD family transcriptional regulator